MGRTNQLELIYALNLQNMRAETVQNLVTRGMSGGAAEAKAELFARCARALSSPAKDELLRAFYVPGRIELLGKHTDYAGGRSILAAAERGFCALATVRSDNLVKMADAADASGATRTEFAIHADLQPTLGHWSNYPMTVARRLARNFPGALRGADIAFASDLPPASGMSSSSALVVLSFLVLSAVNRLDERDEYRRDITSPELLAGYLGTVENGQNFGTLHGDRGVGTFGGSEDHTAILCCQPGRFSQYSYCPVVFEKTIPMPSDHTLAIGVSGVIAEKTGHALERYNRVSRLASAILDLWRRETGRADQTLAAAARSSADAPAELNRIIQSSDEATNRRIDVGEIRRQAMLDRLGQFLVENEYIIPSADDALARRDLTRFGELVDRSQKLAESGLGNQTPETAFMAESARQNGAVAASAFGAGFGGSVWAMVPLAPAPSFLDLWQRAYRERFPQCAARASFFLTNPGPSAAELVGGWWGS